MKQKISFTCFKKGNIPWNKGESCSEETKGKISLALKGRHVWNKGKVGCYSDETKQKMSVSHKGKRTSEETKKKMFLTLNGKSSWFKGKHHSGHSKQKMSEAHKGKPAWNKGKIGCFSKETLKKMSKARKGKRSSEETKKKMSNARKGEKHYNWMGGISFEPYGLEFNKELKLLIRQRDNFTCQECNYTEEQLDRKSDVHHIDYNKKNNIHTNLITLCRGCNAQANFGREDWTQYFQARLI